MNGNLFSFCLLISVIILFTQKNQNIYALPADEDSLLLNEDYTKLPTIIIVVLFRNKAHTMPYFFNFLHRLDYPKDRISLWFV